MFKASSFMTTWGVLAACLASLTGLPSGNLTAAEFDHAVFQAIRRADTNLLATLIRQGTPVDLRASDGTTPLMYAALRGPTASVELLLRRGANPRLSNKAGVTALLWAADDIEKSQLLLKSGADPKAASNLGNTPLIVAAASPGSSDTVRLLLEKGADPAHKNKRGNSGLISAANSGDLESVRLLLQQKNAKRDVHAALASAAAMGHETIAELLLQAGADPNRGGGRGALNNALLAQKPHLANVLLQRGAKLNRRLSPGAVPSIVLSAYTEKGDCSVMQAMLKAGAEINLKTSNDETAMTWARKRGHEKLIAVLKDAGGKDTSGYEPVKVPARNLTLPGAADGKANQRLLASSVERSLALLQKSSDGFLKKRGSCISCHHQNIPALALGMARDRGLKVDEASVRRMIDAQLRSWRPRIERAYQMDRPVPVPPRFIGYGLLSFAALSYPGDDVTDAMVWYLANIQQTDGRWAAGMMRPPLGGDDVVTTVLGMRSLQLYPLAGRKDEMAERIARAKHWLQHAAPDTHQGQVYQLLGLAFAGEPAEALQRQTNQLAEQQRADGGWAQLPGLASDAWATGQTLYALATSGAMTSDDSRYRKGVEFLLRTQFDDGSWYVRNRTWPFQSYFESEFPFGEDQWIAAPATAWAAMAITMGVRPQTEQPQIADVKSVVTEIKPKPPEAIEFAKHIQPILKRSCVGCHSGDRPKGGFSMADRKSLLKGGASKTPAIVPGKEAQSPLLKYVTDQVEDLEMPPLAKRKQYPALKETEIRLLRDWIRSGARD